MTQPTLQRIPLAAIQVAPENARYGAKDLGDLAALAASIEEVGDLIDPLHVYPEGEAFLAWDGGRRYGALQLLAKGKKPKLPAALVEGVPCLVSASKEDAMLLSAATFIREAMHPADEFLHYKRLFDAGLDHGKIAAACAVPTPRVRQLLRLCAVCPEVLEAFKAGDMALDVVEAFTLSADHAKQMAVLEAVRATTRPPTAWAVRQMFKQDAMNASDVWAVYVGREAYEAAGGTFLTDLFNEDEDWADGGLVRQLAEVKLASLIAEVEAEGWGFVKFVSDRDRYGAWRNGFDRLADKDVEALAVEAKTSLGVFIVQNYDGAMDVKRGWVRSNRAPGATGEAAAKPDPSLYGYGHKGHAIMTQVATVATREALLGNPEAAYDGLLTHLAWIEFVDYPAEGTASRLTEDHPWGAPEVEVTGDEEWEAVREAWKGRFAPLVKDRVAFCDFVGNLSSQDKSQLLALCFGATLWAFEAKTNERKPVRWAHLGWLARRAGVKIAEAWSPSAEFIAGASKDALAGVLADDFATVFTADQPKKVLAQQVSSKAATHAKGWVPKLLRDLVAAPEAPKAPKADAKAKRAAQAAAMVVAEPGEATVAPAEDVEEFPPALRALAGAGKAKPIKGADAGADALPTAPGAGRSPGPRLSPRAAP